MNIPNFYDGKVVDKEGNFTEEWKNIMSQLFNELQKKMSNESHVAPSQSTTNISVLNVPKYKGGLLYDKDTNKLKVNINGTFKEVVTS